MLRDETRQDLRSVSSRLDLSDFGMVSVSTYYGLVKKLSVYYKTLKVDSTFNLSIWLVW